MPIRREFERVEADTPEDWRAWLQANHGRSESVWLVTRKKAAGGSLSWSEAVDQALCFGWIDSLPRKLDAERTMLLVSPRKPTSRWSKVNRRKVERLIAEGMMTPAGLAAVEEAKRRGLWDALDLVEALAIPDDLRAALQARPPALQEFEVFPPSAQRGILEWILAARHPATRARRIAETAAMAERGERANQWRGRKGDATKAPAKSRN